MPATMLNEIIGRNVEAIDVSKGYVHLTIQGGYVLNICNDCELQLDATHSQANEIRVIEYLDRSIVVHFGVGCRLTILTADENYNGPEVFVLGIPKLETYVYRGPDGA
jgi:hypothetical protein